MSTNWTTFFSKKDYNEFIGLVNDYFNKKNIDININDGIVFIQNDKLLLGNLGLDNIAQICHQYKRKEWRDIIYDHFNGIIESNSFDLEFSKKISDFKSVKEYIAVKVHNIEYISQLGEEKVIYRNIMENVIELLVFDLPLYVRSVNREEIKK